MKALRPYQQHLVDQCLSALQAGETPLLVAPTGAGKTVIAAEIVRQFLANHRCVLVTAHRAEIVEQLASAIHEQTGTHPGLLVAGSKCDFADHRVVVGMVPTAIRRLGGLPAGWCLVEDEAHHAVASSWTKLRDALQPTQRVGLTATPVSPSGGGLRPAGFTVLLEGPSVPWLIEHGHLSQFHYYAAPPEQTISTTGIRVVRGDYDPQELAAAINGPKLAVDAVALFHRYCPGAPRTICACATREHAKLVTEQFQQAGITAAYLDGATPRSIRDAVMDQFRTGAITVLAQVALLDEGVDLPSASALLLLRPTRSLRLFRQLVGRVLRTAPGKTQALIVDAAQAYADCGLPDAPIRWTLDGVEPTPPRPTITNADGLVVEHPEAELLLAQQLELERITAQQAEQARFERGRENLCTLVSMARHGRVPRGALITALGKQPRSLAEFKMVGTALSKTLAWATTQWTTQNQELIGRGLPPTPERWPQTQAPSVPPLPATTDLTAVWDAAIERCERMSTRALMTSHLTLQGLGGNAVTVQVTPDWMDEAISHSTHISQALSAATGQTIPTSSIALVQAPGL